MTSRSPQITTDEGKALFRKMANGFESNDWLVTSITRIEAETREKVLAEIEDDEADALAAFVGRDGVGA